MSARLLLVEDDPSLAFVIKDNLIQNGYEVKLADNGDDGLQEFRKHHYDICIVDVMMPKRDGLSLAQAIRAENTQVPILFITAKGMVEDKIAGFNAGGDDYIVKPFSMEELYLRIEVFLKRPNRVDLRDAIVNIGAYQFDFPNLLLSHSQGNKKLTEKEAGVLKLLIENKSRVLKREEILKSIWGDDDYFMGRSLDVFISKLRKYLTDDKRIQINNYHGVGFKLEVSEVIS